MDWDWGRIGAIATIITAFLYIIREWRHLIQEGRSLLGVVFGLAQNLGIWLVVGTIVLVFFLWQQNRQITMQNITIATLQAQISEPVSIANTPIATHAPNQPTPTNTLMPENTSTPLPSQSTNTPVPSGDETKIIETNASIDSMNYNNNVNLIVDKIELLSNGRMRWYISFWNRTDETASMAFGEDKSYVTDELGRQYNILKMSPSGFIDSSVRAGVRLQGWLEFDGPTPGAKEFKLYMIRWSYGFQQLRYDGPVEIFLQEPLISE